MNMGGIVTFRLFSSFVEANKFAKYATVNSGKSAKLSRQADEWLVEYVADGESSESATLNEVGAAAPQQGAALPVVENNAPIVENDLTSTTTIIDDAASVMSELQAKTETRCLKNIPKKVKLERVIPERKVHSIFQRDLHRKAQHNYSGEPRKMFRAIEWEAGAAERKAQSEAKKQSFSELSRNDKASNNKICPICGYSLLPTSSSSQYCKCQRQTSYGINEGIAGTREENKKMRGQLWGDMRNRGRGK